VSLALLTLWISRYPYLNHLVLNAGTASFVAIDRFQFLVSFILHPILTLTAASYIIQGIGERSGDGLGHIWQCNVFGPYILVSPLTQQSHSPSTVLTHNPHSHSLSTPSTENYNPFWKPSTPGQTPTATIPPAFCGRLPSKLRIFTDLRTGNSWKPIIPTKLRNTKSISSPPSSRNRPFCQKNRRIDPQKSGTC
jgi:hypothetical protein